MLLFSLSGQSFNLNQAFFHDLPCYYPHTSPLPFALQNNNPHEWLQVDLGRVKRITGVITQGARSIMTKMMVTEFSVTVSHDERSWSSVLEESSQREKVHRQFTDKIHDPFLTTHSSPHCLMELTTHQRNSIKVCDVKHGLQFEFSAVLSTSCFFIYFLFLRYSSGTAISKRKL